MTAADQHQDCIFCAPPDLKDRSSLVLFLGVSCFIILNRYPYNNGHLMVVPIRHVGTIDAMTNDERIELMELTRRSEVVLTEAYKPQGMNVGLNLGRSGGAGVVNHLHVHIVPRWDADTNFMSVVGNVRVVPEEMEQTVMRLRPLFIRIDQNESTT